MRIAGLTYLLQSPFAPVANRLHFHGIGEPSAGAFLDATRFAVASDESNVIRIYEVNSSTILASVDLVAFTGYDKSDLEDAALGNGIVYWTASQSDSSGGKDKKRKVVFATRIVTRDGSLTLEPMGVVREDLKPMLLRLSGALEETINIEGLAVTPDGHLMFGFRNLNQGKAAVVTLKNADHVLAARHHPAEFGDTALLDLGGRGIRSLERVGDRYMIVAGRPGDADTIGYALYWWTGKAADAPVIWAQQPDFTNFDPEVAMLMPGGKGALIISDDGDRNPKVDQENTASDTRGFSGERVSF